MTTETRCFHCKLDVAPVDEDGCCNACGADLGCTCATEMDTGNHADDCALAVREGRDRLARYVELVRAGYPFGNGKTDGGGNAPGHCHGVAGIWDGDNKREIAGKACELCAAWNAAIASLPA